MSPAVASLVVVIGYALGTFPTAQLVGRRLGFDPTTQGSRNPGASNTVRIGGAKAGVLVLVGDACKGVLAAGLGLAVDGRTLAWLAGAAAVAGHLWPVTRRFKGGKGVATVAGVGLVGAPIGFAVLAVVFAGIVAVSRKAAIGSIVTAALIPFAQAALGQEPVEIAVGVALGAVIIVRHRDNIARLRSGTESGLSRSGPAR